MKLKVKLEIFRTLVCGILSGEHMVTAVFLHEMTRKNHIGGMFDAGGWVNGQWLVFSLAEKTITAMPTA